MGLPLAGNFGMGPQTKMFLLYVASCALGYAAETKNIDHYVSILAGTPSPRMVAVAARTKKFEFV